MQYSLDDFLPDILSVEKPARYLGNENGIVEKLQYDMRIVLCYPDIYEIGMSNNAIRILYAALNTIPDVLCDRVFTPKLDFAELLKRKNIPLFGLDSHEAITTADIIGFSIGYELLATNVLFTLQLGHIPIFKHERTNQDPIVIAGGPGISNPEPFIDFFDGIWIGDAEPDFFNTVKELTEQKKSGASKNELLKFLKASNHFYDGTNTKVSRSIFADFGKVYQKINFPTPCIKPVQEHASVEIMRGCTNGCRFCQAGYIYRPARFKDPAIIIKEIDDKIAQGYSSISLSSLSSGDYPGILELLQTLTQKYRDKHISFQLPSLKIESFSLDILHHISELKKSGLTFAVETANLEWQKQINKIVDDQKVMNILKEAKQLGFQTAKFCFMIGLPINGTLIDEAHEIIQFLKKISSASTLEIHVTISVFVPKPHTPFQDAVFHNPEEVLQAIYLIKDSLKYCKRIKISYHNPYMAQLEYAIAQGDRNMGKIIAEAFESSCVFDAWDDSFNKDVWRELLSYYSPTQEKKWKEIAMLVSLKYTEQEKTHAVHHELTEACKPFCKHPCGSCNQTNSIRNTSDIIGEIEKIKNTLNGQKTIIPKEINNILKYGILVRFSKRNSAALLPHHDIVRHFEMAILRNGLPLAYSKGYHPMPRIEISEPLPLGIESLDEYGLLYFTEAINDAHVILSINTLLPNYLKIENVIVLKPQEQNYISLSSIMDKSIFRICPLQTDSPANHLLFNIENYCLSNAIQCKHNQDSLEVYTDDKSGRIQNIVEKSCDAVWRTLSLKIMRLQQYSSKFNDRTPFEIYQ